MAALQTEDDWKCIPTLVKRGASIGSGATVLCGVTVGENAIVGAGSVLTEDVAPDTIVAGNPARPLRTLERPEMKVPFLDLGLQNESIRGEIMAALEDVLANCAFAGGPFVETFERDFAAFCGCKHAIGVGSGTEALWLSLLALGIGPGDEVITVPNTFIATAEAISFCGAKPVFIDIDNGTYTLDPELIEPAITPRTKAIIPVHLFGQMADMDAVMKVARLHDLYVIEDACQAHGADYLGKKAGTIGHVGCFSFYPGKNLGAFGDAGAVVTNDDNLTDRLRVLRDHGQKTKYSHELIGWNARMDGFQGAVLTVKLRYLREWNAARIRHASSYDRRLAHLEGITRPFNRHHSSHVYHVYALRTPERDVLLHQLAESGVHCGIHYPTPIHLQKAYAHLGLKSGTFPVAEQCAQELLSLPMFPELTEEQIEHVTSQITRFVQRRESTTGTRPARRVLSACFSHS